MLVSQAGAAAGWQNVSGTEKSHRRMLPCGKQFSIEYHFFASPRPPLRHLVALFSAGKHLTGFSAA